MENEHKKVLEALKTIAPILNEKALDYGEACSDRQVTDYMLHRYYEMADISKKVDAAILFLERTQRGSGIGWQPIETAPKVEGQRICLALWDDDNYLCWITVGWWDKKRRAWWHNPDGRPIPPSHWMPLPSGKMDAMEIFRHETAPEDTVEALIDFKRLMEGGEFLVDFIANHERTIRLALGDPTVGIEVENNR